MANDIVHGRWRTFLEYVAAILIVSGLAPAALMFVLCTPFGWVLLLVMALALAVMFVRWLLS